MKILFRFAVIFSASVTLSALMAHLLELYAKLRLSKDNYLAVQSIYSGWYLLGLLEVVVLVLVAAWWIHDLLKKKTSRYLLVALMSFIASLIIFFIFTYPANQQTLNWTTLPENWEVLRKRWEYSHAVHAILYLTGYSALIIKILKEKAL